MDEKVLKLISLLNMMSPMWEQFIAHGADLDVDALMEYIADAQEE